MLVGTLGTPSPPLSKCFLLTGNKKGGALKAEVKSGWYGAPSTMGPLFPARLVFYNRGGGWARGVVNGLMMQTVSQIQDHRRIFCCTWSGTEKEKKNIKKLQRKGEGRRGRGLTEFTPHG